MSDESVKFAVGGAVQINHGTYLKRPADEELFAACRDGEFSYVLACRQIGKSSLMIETAHRLSAAGIKTAWVDLNLIGQNVNADEWYFSLIDALANRLKLAVNVERWWESRPSLSAAPSRFLEFFREVVLQEISDPIVIFVDEIDVTLGLHFTDDFFAAIRTMYTDRAHEPDYRRLTFVLLGVATPDELIKDYTRTPFNIGRGINLRDFTREECLPFRHKLEARYPQKGGSYFDQIYHWTNGHPYLTQKLCQETLGAANGSEPDKLIEQLVNKIFLMPQARTDENIHFVQTRVTADRYAQAMLRTYKHVVEGNNSVSDDEKSPVINRLKLYGLVVEHMGHLKVRNKIYAQAFDAPWVENTLKSIRLGIPPKYTVLQRIGQRGHVTVYLAQTEDAKIDQPVVLKVLHVPEGSTENWLQWIERLQRKSEIVSGVNQPNVVKIFETGRIDDRTLFVAMEYIAGGRLRDKLKDGSLPREEAVGVVRQVGAALTHVHRQGIYHLAVNPNDILFDTQSEPPRLVLTDFGFTKFLQEETGSQNYHNNGTQLGQYIAPEHQQSDPSPAIDVYGLAVTFFEALAGQLPPDRQPGAPLPALSEVAPQVGPYFDKVLCRATAPNPTGRFDTIDAFIEVVEAANEKAAEVELFERQQRAASVVGAAQGYMEKGRYDPEKALSMVEAALEICPGYVDALLLRGRVKLQQNQVEEALADYQQAYRQNQEINSEVGNEYLKVLDRVAENAWQQRAFSEAVKYYQTTRHILEKHDNKTDTTQKMHQKVQARLIEYHYREGVNAYESENNKDIDRAITTLKEHIEALESLEAGEKAKDLCNKLEELQVNKHKQALEAAQAAIDEINRKESHVRFGSEEIFKHYAALDEAYRALIELEPKKEEWQKERRKKLKECAEIRNLFAIRAMEKLEPDYVSALRHYRAILDIKETKDYPSIARELSLNLTQKIADLERTVNYDGKYHEIETLMEKGEYHQALERLKQEFILTGNYEHRGVARMLWGLVHAKRHDGTLPPEWEGLNLFESVSQRLVNSERERIQKLEAELEPWSQGKILKTVDNKSKALRACEKQVESIDKLLDKAEAHGIAETPEIVRCRQDLEEIKSRLKERSRRFFQIEVEETVQKVEAWLQRIEDIVALSQNGDPVKDIPEFLKASDEYHQLIRQDPTFEALQAMLSANVEIEQMIKDVKLRMQEKLPRLLVEDIGRRDEQLNKMSAELSQTKDRLAQTQAKLEEKQRDLTELRTIKTETEKLRNKYTVNKWALPVGLAIALIIGEVAAVLMGLQGLAAITAVAAVLSVIFLIYYIWTYGIS